MKQLKVKLVLSNLEEDVLVELVHVWYKATDKLNPYVTVMLDFSLAFDLINHHNFVTRYAREKMQTCKKGHQRNK